MKLNTIVIAVLGCSIVGQTYSSSFSEQDEFNTLHNVFNQKMIKFPSDKNNTALDRKIAFSGAFNDLQELRQLNRKDPRIKKALVQLFEKLSKIEEADATTTFQKGKLAGFYQKNLAVLGKLTVDVYNTLENNEPEKEKLLNQLRELYTWYLLADAQSKIRSHIAARSFDDWYKAQKNLLLQTQNN